MKQKLTFEMRVTGNPMHSQRVEIPMDWLLDEWDGHAELDWTPFYRLVCIAGVQMSGCGDPNGKDALLQVAYLPDPNDPESETVIYSEDSWHVVFGHVCIADLACDMWGAMQEFAGKLPFKELSQVKTGKVRAEAVRNDRRTAKSMLPKFAKWAIETNYLETGEDRMTLKAIHEKLGAECKSPLYVHYKVTGSLQKALQHNPDVFVQHGRGRGSTWSLRRAGALTG